LSPPNLKQSLDPLSFLLTNGCRWYLGEGIPLQPSTKTEKLQLDAKTNAQVVHFFVTFYFNPQQIQYPLMVYIKGTEKYPICLLFNIWKSK
jgi:hypothetical protein